ncbi:hypothetical protein Tco_1254648 [Tanacetum coccineum]
MIEGTKKQQTYKLIIRSIDVNDACYVLVLPMAVNTASLIFEVMPVHVNAAITKENKTLPIRPLLSCDDKVVKEMKEADMQDMKNYYDGLLPASATTVNSMYGQRKTMFIQTRFTPNSLSLMWENTERELISSEPSRLPVTFMNVNGADCCSIAKVKK